MRGKDCQHFQGHPKVKSNFLKKCEDLTQQAAWKFIPNPRVLQVPFSKKDDIINKDKGERKIFLPFILLEAVATSQSVTPKRKICKLTVKILLPLRSKAIQ